MSIKLISQVLDSTLSSTEKFVAVIYADHANDEGEHIYPSIAKTAKRTSLDPRTVQRATRALEEKGILEFVGETRKRTFEYRMIASKLATGETAESMTPAHDHPQTKATHDPGTRSPMTPAHDHHDPGTRSPMTPAHDHPIRYSDPLFETYIETSEGPNWDELNLGESNVEATEGEIILPQQEPITAQSDNGYTPPAVTPPVKPRRTKTTPDPIVFKLPSKINTPQMQETLQRFEENRRANKNPLTQHAADLLVSKLETVSINEGIERLQTAIMNNWRGVFYPGDENRYAHHHSGNGHNMNGNGRAYTNGATKQNGQQTAVKTWKPGGSY